MAVRDTIEIEVLSATVCVVPLAGEHDAASREPLARAFAFGSAYRYILVDLAACSFIDSTMINAMLAAAIGRRARGGALELVVPVEPNAVRRTLEIANVQMSLPFHASRAAGVAAFEAADRQPGVAGRLRPRAPQPGVVVVRAQIRDSAEASRDGHRAP